MNLRVISQILANNRGFTLMELAVVIAIIGILVTITIPRYSEVDKSARIAKGKVDFRTIVTALELYHNDNGKYPLDNDDDDFEKYLPKWPEGASYSSDDGKTYTLTIMVDDYEINKDNL